ncbi:uncharacterized protein [Petaurus breviceps papuanus]|uniref:uncharacterized protein n=1 Tax=Petaurus breviceps papuanus TaxID=3040969 RepID=UPI0036D89DF7
MLKISPALNNLQPGGVDEGRNTTCCRFRYETKVSKQYNTGLSLRSDRSALTGASPNPRAQVDSAGPRPALSAGPTPPRPPGRNQISSAKVGGERRSKTAAGRGACSGGGQLHTRSAEETRGCRGREREGEERSPGRSPVAAAATERKRRKEFTWANRRLNPNTYKHPTGGPSYRGGIATGTGTNPPLGGGVSACRLAVSGESVPKEGGGGGGGGGKGALCVCVCLSLGLSLSEQNADRKCSCRNDSLHRRQTPTTSPSPPLHFRHCRRPPASPLPPPLPLLLLLLQSPWPLPVSLVAARADAAAAQLLSRSAAVAWAGGFGGGRNRRPSSGGYDDCSSSSSLQPLPRSLLFLLLLLLPPPLLLLLWEKIRRLQLWASSGFPRRRPKEGFGVASLPYPLPPHTRTFPGRDLKAPDTEGRRGWAECPGFSPGFGNAARGWSRFGHPRFDCIFR